MVLDTKDNNGYAEKQTNEKLFESQKHMLNMFLERNAITKEEYDKCLNVLKTKMKP